MELKDKLNEKVFDEYYEYIKGIDMKKFLMSIMSI